MRLSERVKEIVEMNLARGYIPLVIQTEPAQVIPMFFARLIGENVLAFPITGTSRMDEALTSEVEAQALVVDRDAGFEAYLIRGRARHVTREQDYELVVSMKNTAPGFPVHSALRFEMESAKPVPPP